MTERRFPPPWTVVPLPGGFKVAGLLLLARDTGRCRHGRGVDDGRSAADRSQHRQAAGIVRRGGQFRLR